MKPESPHDTFARDLRRTLERLRAGRLKLHIPREQDLHRRRPDSHFHPAPELFIQTGGGTDFVCPANNFRLATNEVCVMPKGVPHAEAPLDLRTPYGILVCMQDVNRNGFFLHRGRADPARRIQGYGTLHMRGPYEFFNYLDDVSGHRKIAAGYRPDYVRSLLEAFFLTILSCLEHPQKTLPADASPLVIEAGKYVLTHLADSRLGVTGMAAALGCTPDHLSRQFRRERGLNLMSWIASERIAQAKVLLTDLRYNIAEIGWACGFNETSYFIRIFRRHTGVTPRAWRQKAVNAGRGKAGSMENSRNADCVSGVKRLLVRGRPAPGQ
ncbi:MAG: helix-turn-helix transcriptional regulator [Opitutaceae bacterium]|jgi:AraC-like DNA-binding protein|nr:helix-turn-helix transcriptional regulator [Opitutaceae bacterium]